MPKQEQTITLTNSNRETTLAICYQAFKNLGWEILFAGDENIIVQTPKKWNSNPQHVVVSSNGSELNVSSEMIKDELVDITGKNKKNIASFINAFEAAKNNTDIDAIEGNKLAIEQLRAATKTTIEQENKNAEEVDKAMNLSGSNLYVTYAIIAINTLVFVLMAINGAGIFEANGYVHMKWGSNYGPLTLGGDWWRLITNVFIHFGIIHLAMNMYCLYTAGVYLEPMLGKLKYTTAYLCTGILASIASLWWHKEAVNSAGASGAIFGMYGLFLALLTTNLIPKQVRQSLLQSIGIFVVYNLVYGMKGGVDNSAHVGGLLSGFIIGYIYAYGIKKERQEQKIQWILPLVLLVTLAGAYGYLQKNEVPASERNAVLNEIKGASYADGEKFNNRYNQFIELQDKALAVLSDTTLTDEALQQQLNETSLPQWQKAETLAKEMQLMDVSDDMHKKANTVLEYIQLRKEEVAIIKEMIANKTPTDTKKLEDVRNKINNVVETLK
ncbi:MAG: rhomboid family intramembrane serine protease [Ferruginibacter sp.]